MSCLLARYKTGLSSKLAAMCRRDQLPSRVDLVITKRISNLHNHATMEIPFPRIGALDLGSPSISASEGRIFDGP